MCAYTGEKGTARKIRIFRGNLRDMLYSHCLSHMGILVVYLFLIFFVSRMHLKKTDIQFHDNHTVSYRQPEKFIYDEEASVGSENDTFTTLNIPFLVKIILRELFIFHTWLEL